LHASVLLVEFHHIEVLVFGSEVQEERILVQLVQTEACLLLLAEHAADEVLEGFGELDLVQLGAQFLLLDQLVEVLVLTLVRVFEAGVAEHAQLGDHPQCEHVRLLSVLLPLLVYFGAGLHARARDPLLALRVEWTCEPLVGQSDDELLVQ